MLEEIILFTFTFLLIYGIYAMMILKSEKRLEKYKTSVEIKDLEGKYHIQTNRFEFRKLARMVLITNTFDICVTAALACLIPNFILMFLVGVLILLVVIFISYHLLGTYLKKLERKM
ncbi:MAG: hypothetical protein KH135_02040 [Firmicutes bacterium]|nr:hypothetical protein [Bacillota bacterium]